MKKKIIKLAHPRVAYSVEMLKETLLFLLTTRRYSDITVMDLCRQAEISRGTFYKHFRHIGELVDLLLDDVLNRIGNVPLQSLCKPVNRSCDGQPLCGFLRKHRKYIPLFLSDSLSSHSIRRTVDHLLPGFLSVMKDRTKMDEDLLGDLLYYQITGCIAVFGRHLDVSDEEWDRRKCNVDTFLVNGLGFLQED